MRKKTINRVADTIFWYLLYFMPVLAYLILIAVQPGSITTLDGVFDILGLNVFTTGTIYTSLDGIFGVNGILPLFTQTGLLQFFTYFISVYIAHLFVDFLLFIPRIAHKWMSKAYQEGE